MGHGVAKRLLVPLSGARGGHHSWGGHPLLLQQGEAASLRTILCVNSVTATAVTLSVSEVPALYQPFIPALTVTASVLALYRPLYYSSVPASLSDLYYHLYQTCSVSLITARGLQVLRKYCAHPSVPAPDTARVWWSSLYPLRETANAMSCSFAKRSLV